MPVVILGVGLAVAGIAVAVLLARKPKLSQERIAALVTGAQPLTAEERRIYQDQVLTSLTPQEEATVRQYVGDSLAHFTEVQARIRAGQDPGVRISSTTYARRLAETATRVTTDRHTQGLRVTAGLANPRSFLMLDRAITAEKDAISALRNRVARGVTCPRGRVASLAGPDGRPWNGWGQVNAIWQEANRVSVSEAGGRIAMTSNPNTAPAEFWDRLNARIRARQQVSGWRAVCEVDAG